MKNTIEVKCPCGKVLVDTSKMTGRLECPDKDCWIIHHKEEVWVGKPQKEIVKIIYD